MPNTIFVFPYINRKQHFKSHLLVGAVTQPLSFRCYSDSIKHITSLHFPEKLRHTRAPRPQQLPRIQHPQAVHLFTVGDMRAPVKEGYPPPPPRRHRLRRHRSVLLTL